MPAERRIGSEHEGHAAHEGDTSVPIFLRLVWNSSKCSPAPKSHPALLLSEGSLRQTFHNATVGGLCLVENFKGNRYSEGAEKTFYERESAPYGIVVRPCLPPPTRSQ